MDFRRILSKQKSIDIETCLPYGLMFVSREGMIQWVNSQFTEYVNMEKESIITNNIDTLFNKGLEAIAKSAATRTPQAVTFEVNGDCYEVLAREVEQGFTVDIRKLTTTQPATLTKEETVINRNKNSLIVKLTSDIKAPIQSIIGFSQALLDGLGGEMNEKQEKYTSIINKNASELLFLTENMAELSKAELGLLEKDCKLLDVVSYIQNLTRVLEQTYKDKNLTIKFEADPAIKKTFTIDENALKNTIKIIVDTVVRYMELGDITVLLSVPSTSILERAEIQNGIIISVICTGFSISEQELQILFDPYAIAESPMKRYISRSMALAIVKNLVDSMNGRMQVTSEILKNTTFNILIPIQERDLDE